ncbi:LysE family translocator [Enterococcus wangshanyuanii]|uniref:Lysine transporter LysE n=1 Tax=Enterococcus wangshanyuanii TaxID=2005703 RepID=A0ABQ1PVQ3_9ENTE|nr:LysE family translocator [Enterococcus wangshanyuanii]GGD04932.1 lysine transporter LysE [Enterococcus wangshanyuanii]
MGIINFGTFIVSAILLNLIPGSDTIYILSKSALGSKRQGIISVFGISSGILVHTILAAVGLSAVLMTSAMAFNTMKWLGAGYLIYLGISSILKKEPLMDVKEGQTTTDWQVYKQGLMTNVLNPKVALFFLSLLPQYVDANAQSGSLPFLVLGITFVCTSTIWSLAIAYGASFFVGLFNKNDYMKKATNKIAGCIYICLGLNLLRATANTN